MSNEALAAWAGVIVTLVISVWSLFLARRAEKVSQRATLEREAARVSAWVSTVWANSAPNDDAQKRNILVIRNASEAAIHNVEAEAVMHGKDYSFSATVCPPGESYSAWRDPEQEYIWTFLASTKELERADCTARPFTKSAKWKLTRLRFTDALGARWEYTSGGGVRRAA